MGRQIVAHGVNKGSPPDDLPYIPDLFVLCEGKTFWSVSKSGTEMEMGDVMYLHMIDSGQVTPLKGPPPPWEAGKWAAVDLSGLSFFDREMEDKWKSDRSMSLIQEATAVVGNPEKALSLLRAAGSLVGLSVPQLVGHLEKMRKNPKESLFEIYKRTK